MLELRQTRDLTKAEIRQLSRMSSVSVMRACSRDPLFWASLCVIVVGGATVFKAIKRYMFLAWCAGVFFPRWAEAVLLLALGSFLVMSVRMRNVAASSIGHLCKAGTRYAIREDGLAIEMPDAASFLPWRGMKKLKWNDWSLSIQLTDIQSVVIPNGPFEGQDVEAFCAELERRWWAARSQGDDAAAGGAA
ncbi:MAG: hypothetical protein R3D05_06610 [Dongiaceae bacterium]